MPTYTTDQAALVGGGATQSYDDGFSTGWWDQNGAGVVSGIAGTLGSLFQNLPGIIAAANYDPSNGNPYQPYQPVAQPQPAPQAQANNTMLYIIVIVVILALVGGGIFLATRKSA